MAHLATWLLAVVVATGLGLFAINAVGTAVRDRGPLGHAVARVDPVDEGTGEIAIPHASDVVIERRLGGDYGSFDVACQGPYALGQGATATTTDGWRVLRYEPGPDDDVAAVFVSSTEFVELEVFCDQGTPAVAELDRSHVGEDDTED